MTNDPDILAGNKEDLEDFKKHFNIHDKKTLDTYFRQATKKESMMIVRRYASNSPRMDVIVVSYKMAAVKGGIREALKSRSYPNTGFVKAIHSDPHILFVFGELIPKHDGVQFQHPVPEKKKRKPFEPR